MTDTERLDWLERFAGFDRGPCAARLIKLWASGNRLWTVEIDNTLDMEDYGTVEVGKDTRSLRDAIDAAMAAVDGCDGKKIETCIDPDGCERAGRCIAKHIPKSYAEWVAEYRAARASP